MSLRLRFVVALVIAVGLSAAAVNADPGATVYGLVGCTEGTSGTATVERIDGGVAQPALVTGCYGNGMQDTSIIVYLGGGMPDGIRVTGSVFGSLPGGGENVSVICEATYQPSDRRNTFVYECGRGGVQLRLVLFVIPNAGSVIISAP